MSDRTRTPLLDVLLDVLFGFSVLLFLPNNMQGQVAVDVAEAVDAPAAAIDNPKPVSQIGASTTGIPKPALVPVNLSKLTDGTSKREGWALAFNGRGDHITAPYIPFAEYKALTVEAWVRGWRLAILCQGRAGDPENSIWLSLGMNAKQPHETCGWEYGTGKNHQVAVGKANPIEWNHVALVYDGTRQYIFLNGKLKQSRPVPKPGPFNKSRKLIIGAHQFQSLSYGSGLLGSVRISKVARYRANFTPSQKLSTDADTVLLYDMSQGKGTRLRDASGNKHDGTITGARWLKANEIFSLDLSGTQVTDAGLKQLKALSSLELLSLEGTTITDAGLEHLKFHKSLKTLNLNHTRVTDAGLLHLKGVTNLETLYLTNSRVTPAGVNQLKQALPKTKIVASRSVVRAPSSVVVAPKSADELLKRLDTIREKIARFKGQPKPAVSAKSERKLHAMIETPRMGSYYSSSSGGGRRYDRYLAAQLVLVNNTTKPVKVKQEQLQLKTEDKTYKIQKLPNQARYQSFRIKRKFYQLYNLKLLKDVTVPPGKSVSSWVVFTGISPGSVVPKLVLEINAEGNRTELNINDFALGMLDLKVERIGPRKALALLTISGRLNTVNLGSITKSLDQLNTDNVARAVIRWTKKAEEVDPQLLNWIKQAAAMAGSGNTFNNPQMPMIAPASIRELHLAQIPNDTSSRTGSTRIYSPYGGSIQVNLQSHVHKTDIDAVGAALETAFRNLPADEVIREIESGHPLTRVAAIAHGGGRLPEEKLPVLLKYADHKDPRFQKAALFALGHFGKTEAIDKLIAATRLSNNDLSKVATESLAASRYSAAHRALLDVLNSKDSPSKKVIIGALARYPRPLWSETIYKIASELDSETGVVALQALARIGHPELRNLFRKALKHSNSKLRDESFKLLLTQADLESERMALDYTLNHLKKSPPTSQMYSLLSRVKDPRAVPMLLKHLRETKGANSQVINLLAQIGDQTVADVFVEMYPQLKGTSSKTTVLNALQQLRSPAFRKLAGQALLEKDASLVSTASRSLQADGSPEAIRLLIEAFEKSKHSSTWNYTANALGTIGTAEARAALMKARDSKNTRKKSVAVNALRNLQRRSPGYRYISQGDSYRNQKQWDNAINYYTIAIKIDPELADAYSGRANAYMNKGKSYKKAKSDFIMAEKLDPNNHAAKSGSALILIFERKYEQGINKIEQGHQQFSKEKRYVFETARAYGRAARMIQKFDKKLSEEERRKKVETYRKKCLENLQQAVKLGFNNYTWMKSSTDLDVIKNTPEFKKIIGADKSKPKTKTEPKKKSNKKKAVPVDSPAVPAVQADR